MWIIIVIVGLIFGLFAFSQIEPASKAPQIIGAIIKVVIGIDFFSFPSRSNFFARGQAETKG